VRVSTAGDALDPSAPRRLLPARTLGVVAVPGLVVAFSLRPDGALRHAA